MSVCVCVCVCVCAPVSKHLLDYLLTTCLSFVCVGAIACEQYAAQPSLKTLHAVHLWYGLILFVFGATGFLFPQFFSKVS